MRKLSISFVNGTPRCASDIARAEYDSEARPCWPHVTPKVTSVAANSIFAVTSHHHRSRRSDFAFIALTSSSATSLELTSQPIASQTTGRYCADQDWIEEIMGGPSKIASNWLGYIRPHIRPYEALGPGERLKYIAKLSKATKLSDNSLRRFIAAAQFLEGEGITELSPGRRMPVAAVERIARIAAREPERRRQLLDDLAAGNLTVEQLVLELKKSKQIRRSRVAIPASSLEDLAKAQLQARGIAAADDMKVFPFEEVDTPEYYDWQTKPALAIILPHDRRIAVMDATRIGGPPSSFIRQRKEFKRNIVSAAAFYDYVLVYALSWRADVEKLLMSVRSDVRARIIPIETSEELSPRPSIGARTTAQY